MEFFAALNQITNQDLVVSVDVGKIYQDRGFIDFTLHSRTSRAFYGIELLRERHRLGEHMERFQVGGNYTNMVSLFTDDFVVDFRERKRGAIEAIERDVNLHAKLLIVSYDHVAFDDFRVHSQGREVYRIRSMR
jgi:hypothetical protein